MDRWKKTQFKAAIADSGIDRKTGILKNVVMCQAGEAKGHGVSLEQEFIDRVVELAKGYPAGMKARFGHPGMSDETLGKAVGRFKNPRIRGSQAIADLHLAGYAKASPDGDLHNYILDRAQEDPDSFGSSIVFKPGQNYQRNANGEKIYRSRLNTDGERERNPDWIEGETQFAEINELLGCDLVDEGAATDSLFHKQYNSHAFAVRFEAFLEENPDIEQFLNEHPNLEQKIEEYIVKRKAYKSQSINLHMDQPTEIPTALSLKERVDRLWQQMFSPAPPVEEVPAPAEDPDPAAELSALQSQNETLTQQLKTANAKIAELEPLMAQIEKLEAEVLKLAAKPAAKVPEVIPPGDLALSKKGEADLLPETAEAIRRFDRRKAHGG